MLIDGKKILKALRELVAPSTPQEIAQHIAKKRKRQPDLKKLEQEVVEALSGGRKFGFVEMCNGHYYNLEDTERELKLIENEGNQKRKLRQNLVWTDSDTSDNIIPFLKKRKRFYRGHSFNKKKPFYLPPKKRKRRHISTTLDQTNFTVIPQAAHSMPSNSVRCVASNEKQSIRSDNAKYDLAMGAEMAKAKIDVIIDEIAANYFLFEAPSSGFSRDQRTSELLKQNVENPIASSALREAATVVNSKLDEIVDNIVSCFEQQNIAAKKSKKFLQFISSDFSISSTNEILSKMSVQNYLKEHDGAQNSKQLMKDEDAAISELSNALLQKGQGNFENSDNEEVLMDYMSLPASGSTGVPGMLQTQKSIQVANPRHDPKNTMKSATEPEDITYFWPLYDFCPRCWFENGKCQCNLV
ncbi:uncharacterized protein LOC119689405 [Teleopsis dalmanni]|uniref:uncharacterized protein LOC119689405 n=1 Tax=Teleopsis dalmanni TaxID=139649 RepID=UPI0018CF61FE|nr:uncharacterized protein LOC119689405 [Teleopsis dalmanni]